jgi:hypothetical protein
MGHARRPHQTNHPIPHPFTHVHPFTIESGCDGTSYLPTSNDLPNHHAGQQGGARRAKGVAGASRAWLLPYSQRSVDGVEDLLEILEGLEEADDATDAEEAQ